MESSGVCVCVCCGMVQWQQLKASSGCRWRVSLRSFENLWGPVMQLGVYTIIILFICMFVILVDGCGIWCNFLTLSEGVLMHFQCKFLLVLPNLPAMTGWLLFTLSEGSIGGMGNSWENRWAGQVTAEVGGNVRLWKDRRRQSQRNEVGDSAWLHKKSFISRIQEHISFQHTAPRQTAFFCWHTATTFSDKSSKIKSVSAYGQFPPDIDAGQR